MAGKRPANRNVPTGHGVRNQIGQSVLQRDLLLGGSGFDPQKWTGSRSRLSRNILICKWLLDENQPHAGGLQKSGTAPRNPAKEGT